MKKKILISYPEMMLGGSTTSLISLLNCIDYNKYSVDLQLYKNRGEMYQYIPAKVNVLKEACKYNSSFGRIIKIFKFVFSKYFFKSKSENRKNGKKGYSGQVLYEFQAKKLSRFNKKEYDYAVGFLEGWSDRYIAYCVKSKKKYGWYHNTLENILSIFYLEKEWINKVDKVVFCSEDCRKDISLISPDFESKSVTIENIFDSSIIKMRSEEIDDNSYPTALRESDKLKIMFVGRLDKKIKGLDRVVNAVKYLKNKGYLFVWYLVGDGKDKAEIEKMIKDYHLEDYLILTGMKKNPYPYLKEADLLCMPSRFEGKPMTVTEAKILGVPCVVTNYLSAHEQIINGKEGIIVENSDYSIIPALEKLINNRDIIQNMKVYLQNNVYGNTDYIKVIEKELFN